MNKLKCEREIKYLGIIIDDKLNFKPNIDYVAKKIGRKIGVPSRLNHKLNLQQKIAIYRSIIEPHFNYCSSVLFLSSESDLKRLQKLQNKCLKNIIRMKITTSQKDLLQITELMSVYQIIFKNTMISIFKIINKIWPKYLHNNIKFKCDNERKKTLRCKNDIELKVAKKHCTQNSIFFKGLDIYNKLPVNIKETTNLESFIIKIKKYVKESVN